MDSDSKEYDYDYDLDSASLSGDDRGGHFHDDSDLEPKDYGKRRGRQHRGSRRSHLPEAAHRIRLAFRRRASVRVTFDEKDLTEVGKGIVRLFQHYAGEGAQTISAQSFTNMATDMLNDSTGRRQDVSRGGTARDAERVFEWAQQRGQRNAVRGRGKAGPAGTETLSFSEFMSFCTMPFEELEELAFRLKDPRVWGSKRDLKKTFGYYVKKGEVDYVRFARQIKEHYKYGLTGAEVRTVLKEMAAPRTLGKVDVGLFERMITGDGASHHRPRREERRRLRAHIMDLQLSSKKGDEAKLRAEHFTKLRETLNVGSWGSSVNLWYRSISVGEVSDATALETSMGGPVTDVRVTNRKKSASLSASKYNLVCGANLNQGLVFNGDSTYLWYKRGNGARYPLVDLAITKGRAKDLHDPIYQPPYGGFKQVEGNLNEGMGGSDIFLWMYKESYDEDEEPTYAVPTGSGRAALDSQVMDAIKGHVREVIRRQAIQSGKVDFVALFRKHHATTDGSADPKLNFKQFTKLMRNLNIEQRDDVMRELFASFDLRSQGHVDAHDFEAFLELMPADLDDLARSIRKEVLHQADSGGGRRALERRIERYFARLDGDNDGRVRCDDLGKLVEDMLYVKLSPVELQRLIARFDPEASHRKSKRVSWMGFLEFILEGDRSIDDRAFLRVTKAAHIVRDRLLRIANSAPKQRHHAGGAALPPPPPYATEAGMKKAWKAIKGARGRAVPADCSGNVGVEELEMFLHKARAEYGGGEGTAARPVGGARLETRALLNVDELRSLLRRMNPCGSSSSSASRSGGRLLRRGAETDPAVDLPALCRFAGIGPGADVPVCDVAVSESSADEVRLFEDGYWPRSFAVCSADAPRGIWVQRQERAHPLAAVAVAGKRGPRASSAADRDRKWTRIKPALEPGIYLWMTNDLDGGDGRGYNTWHAGHHALQDVAGGVEVPSSMHVRLGASRDVARNATEVSGEVFVWYSRSPEVGARVPPGSAGTALPLAPQRRPYQRTRRARGGMPRVRRERKSPKVDFLERLEENVACGLGQGNESRHDYDAAFTRIFCADPKAGAGLTLSQFQAQCEDMEHMLGLPQVLQPSDQAAAFSALDMDDDGQVTSEDFHRFFTQGGVEDALALHAADGERFDAYQGYGDYSSASDRSDCSDSIDASDGGVGLGRSREDDMASGYGDGDRSSMAHLSQAAAAIVCRIADAAAGRRGRRSGRGGVPSRPRVLMRDRFLAFDVRRTGAVRRQDFAEALRKHGLRLPAHDMDVLMDTYAVGSTADGTVAYGNLCDDVAREARVRRSGGPHGGLAYSRRRPRRSRRERGARTSTDRGLYVLGDGYDGLELDLHGTGYGVAEDPVVKVALKTIARTIHRTARHQGRRGRRRGRPGPLSAAAISTWVRGLGKGSRRDRAMPARRLQAALQRRRVRLPHDEMEALMDFLDPDGHGTVDSRDLTDALVRTMEGDGAPTSASVLDLSAILDRIRHAMQFAHNRGIDTATLFALYDTASRGTVSRVSFSRVLSKLGIRLNAADLGVILEWLGTADSGARTVNYRELLRAVAVDGAPVVLRPNGVSVVRTAEVERRLRDQLRARGLAGRPALDLRRHFQALDKNGSAQIPISDIPAALAKCGVSINDDDLHALAARYAAPVPGLVRYGELCATLVDEPVDVEGLRDRVRGVLEAATRRGVTVRQAFKARDVANCATLSRADFRSTLAGLGVQLSDLEFRRLMDRFDVLQDGQVAYDEFVSFVLPPGTDMDVETLLARLRHSIRRGAITRTGTFDFRQPFERYDRDRRGVLSRERFRDALRGVNAALDDRELDALVTRFGAGPDGKVDYRSFCKFAGIDEDEMDRLATRLHAHLADLVRQHVDYREAFEMFDQEISTHPGFITRYEFREAARQIGLPVTETELVAVLERFAHFTDTDLVQYGELFRFIALRHRSATLRGQPVGSIGGYGGTGGSVRGAVMGTGRAVDGSGFDGLGFHGQPHQTFSSGGVFAPGVVDRWLTTAASPAEQRGFAQVYGRVSRFHDEERRKARETRDSNAFFDHASGTIERMVDHTPTDMHLALRWPSAATLRGVRAEELREEFLRRSRRYQQQQATSSTRWYDHEGAGAHDTIFYTGYQDYPERDIDSWRGRRGDGRGGEGWRRDSEDVDADRDDRYRRSGTGWRGGDDDEDVPNSRGGRGDGWRSGDRDQSRGRGHGWQDHDDRDGRYSRSGISRGGWRDDDDARQSTRGGWRDDADDRRGK